MMKGKVFLVGAGPGDPGLMTVRGASLVATADAIVMDALVNPLVVAGARGQVIDAGKRGRSRRRPGHGPSQSTINALLVRLARRGLSVVRLKGGDPFVFGRGSEEIEALRRANIPFEVVPGVTSAVAAPAYAGIPVTDRRWASQVTFVTGHETIEERNAGGVDWARISPDGTLVVLMGVTAWPDVAARLLENGWKPTVPCAAVERGTTVRQRVIRSTLRESAADFRKGKLSAPAIVVVGAVAGLAGRFDWFRKERPLFGRRIVVTRANDAADGLADLLAREGAVVVRCPLIDVKPYFSPEMRRVRDGHGTFDWIVFLSANGVRHFSAFLGSRARPRARVAAVGPQTAQAATDAGWGVDRVARRFDAAGALSALGDVRGRRILIPRAVDAPEDVVRAFRARGAEVTVVPVYETRRLKASAGDRAAVLSGVDAVTFLSASTVEAFAASFTPAQRRRLFRTAVPVVIGPATERALRSAGVRSAVRSPEATSRSVVDALRRLLAVK